MKAITTEQRLDDLERRVAELEKSESERERRSVNLGLGLCDAMLGKIPRSDYSTSKGVK